MFEDPCPRCRRLIQRKQMRTHQAGKHCAIDTLALSLLERGLVPFPRGHSLPDFVPVEVHQTRVPYEGARYEPTGAAAKRCKMAEEQHWVPAWVRAVTEAWARTSAEVWFNGHVLKKAAAERKVERDEAMRRLLDLGADAQQAVLTASARGDRAVLELVRALVRQEASCA